jgi:hypothetical protein
MIALYSPIGSYDARTAVRSMPPVLGRPSDATSATAARFSSMLEESPPNLVDGTEVALGAPTGTEIDRGIPTGADEATPPQLLTPTTFFMEKTEA